MKGFFQSTAFTALLLVIGYFWLDIRLAELARTIVGPAFLHSGTVSGMPDILFSLVCFVTVVGWGGYFYTVRRPSRAISPYFFRLIGSTVPLAYLLKTVAKYLVGRPNTRWWLLDPTQYSLHWFHGGGGFSGFPSGHMAVFTALMLGVSRFFPRLRNVCHGLLIILALALMLTGYHFFSDIIAGAYLGWVIDTLIVRDCCPKDLVTQGNRTIFPWNEAN